MWRVTTGSAHIAADSGKSSSPCARRVRRSVSIPGMPMSSVISGSMLVGDLMTRELVTLSQAETLSIADRIMALGRIRHMPVVDDDGRLVGLISQRDLFRGALARAIGLGGPAGQT